MRSSDPAIHAVCLIFTTVAAACGPADASLPIARMRELGLPTADARLVSAERPRGEWLAASATTPREQDDILAGLRIPTEQIQAQYTPDLAMCLKTGAAAQGVSVAMGGCFNAELKVQDARLNAAYHSAMRTRGLPERTKLRNIQRAWIKRRDGECQEVAIGGTIDLVDIPSCRLDETVRRRIVLQSLAN